MKVAALALAASAAAAPLGARAAAQTAAPEPAAWVMADSVAHTATIALEVTAPAGSPSALLNGFRDGRGAGGRAAAVDRGAGTGARRTPAAKHSLVADGGAREASHRGRPAGVHQRHDSRDDRGAPGGTDRSHHVRGGCRPAGTGCSAACRATPSRVSGSASRWTPTREPPASCGRPARPRARRPGSRSPRDRLLGPCSCPGPRLAQQPFHLGVPLPHLLRVLRARGRAVEARLDPPHPAVPPQEDRGRKRGKPLQLRAASPRPPRCR